MSNEDSWKEAIAREIRVINSSRKATASGADAAAVAAAAAAAAANVQEMQDGDERFIGGGVGAAGPVSLGDNGAG